MKKTTAKMIDGYSAVDAASKNMVTIKIYLTIKYLFIYKLLAE